MREANSAAATKDRPIGGKKERVVVGRSKLKTAQIAKSPRAYT